MNSKSKIQNYFIAFLAFVILFSAAPVFAAEIFFETESSEIKLDDQFEVGVFLNTENEDINAIEGKIIFPADILELKEIKDGNSIINFWVERPKAKNGEILFSGIIPGGYFSKKGLIFSAVFQSIQEGQRLIEIRDAKVLLNDGKGTPTETTIFNFQFNINDVGRRNISDVRRPGIGDKEPPETFKPEIAQNSDMFNGQWFLVFATQDKGHGIDYYAVRETDAKWQMAESPYVLKDQKLRSFVYVKAVDKAGNERIVVVEPRYPMRWYENWRIWVIIILGIVICIFRKILWQKFIKSC